MVLEGQRLEKTCTSLLVLVAGLVGLYKVLNALIERRPPKASVPLGDKQGWMNGPKQHGGLRGQNGCLGTRAI